MAYFFILTELRLFLCFQSITLACLVNLLNERIIRAELSAQIEECDSMVLHFIAKGDKVYNYFKEALLVPIL